MNASGQKKLDPLRIGIVGSGPIGRLFVAVLAQSGHHVTLLCRNEGDAINLRAKPVNVTGLITATGAAAQTFHEPGAFLHGSLDYVLICTKAAENSRLAHQFTNCIGAEKPVFVSCQNGIDVEEVFVHHFGEAHALRMILNVGCNLTTTGGVDVKFKFADILSANSGAGGADQRLGQALNQAGIAVNLSENYRQEAFRKAILNTALGTVCAITRLTMREVMQRPDLHRMVQEIVREGARVGAHLGFDFGPEFLQEAMAYLSQGGDHMPSLAVDIVKGNVTENQWLAGAIYHYAERLGVDVPVIQTVYYFIKNIEGR